MTKKFNVYTSVFPKEKDALYGTFADYDSELEPKLTIFIDDENHDDAALKNEFFTRLKLLENQKVDFFLMDESSIYWSSIDRRNIWVEKNNIIVLFDSEIISTNVLWEKPDLNSKLYDSIEFEVESNKNKRNVLKNYIQSKIQLGTYSETGNQYSRKVTIKFEVSQTIQSCLKIIRDVILIRTFIDGFQNYESNVILISDHNRTSYKYISRRIVNKYRWYQSARFDKISDEQYFVILDNFNSRIDIPSLTKIIEICEYLHQPNFSLPTSRFFEIITAFEGYSKTNKEISVSSQNESSDWSSLHLNIKKLIDGSNFELKIKKDMINRINIINPYNERLTIFIINIFKLTFGLLNLQINEKSLIPIAIDMTAVRNSLGHNPSEYESKNILKDDKLIHAREFLK